LQVDAKIRLLSDDVTPQRRLRLFEVQAKLGVFLFLGSDHRLLSFELSGFLSGYNYGFSDINDVIVVMRYITSYMDDGFSCWNGFLLVWTLTSYQLDQGGKVLPRGTKFFVIMERVYESSNGNGPTSNDHMVMRHSPKSPYQSFSKRSLRWLDLRVFYVRVSKCETDESTPMHLTLNHVPLNPDTLLEVNGVRTGIYSDGPSTLLRRDRLDKKSEEATFVSTDSIRLTGSMKFEVFNKDTLLLYGVLELCDRNGCTKESKGSGPMWSMNCESVITTGTGFLKAKQFHSPSSTSPTV
ncbi:hypothetical protein Goarm_000229, partial [Gossypium armourianum]|nr:hypothetical protein [Gossypium armourianum]